MHKQLWVTQNGAGEQKYTALTYVTVTLIYFMVAVGLVYGVQFIPHLLIH